MGVSGAVQAPLMLLPRSQHPLGSACVGQFREDWSGQKSKAASLCLVGRQPGIRDITAPRKHSVEERTWCRMAVPLLPCWNSSQQEAREAQGEDSLRFRPAFLHSAPGSCAGSLQTTMGLLSPPLLAFCQKSRRDRGTGDWNKMLLAFEALTLPVRLPNKASPPCQPCGLHWSHSWILLAVFQHSQGQCHHTSWKTPFSSPASVLSGAAAVDENVGTSYKSKHLSTLAPTHGALWYLPKWGKTEVHTESFGRIQQQLYLWLPEWGNERDALQE